MPKIPTNTVDVALATSVAVEEEEEEDIVPSIVLLVSITQRWRRVEAFGQLEVAEEGEAFGLWPVVLRVIIQTLHRIICSLLIRDRNDLFHFLAVEVVPPTEIDLVVLAGWGQFCQTFVGSVPRTAREEDIRHLFEEHGDVIEVALIKDKKNWPTSRCAERLIGANLSSSSSQFVFDTSSACEPSSQFGYTLFRENYGTFSWELLANYDLETICSKELFHLYITYYLVLLCSVRGCCFIKYATLEEADRAIRALHNQHTLPGGVGPIQVRYAGGRERLGAVEYKLFVGSLNKQATEMDVQEVFSRFGRVEDVYLMRDESKQSRGCGFVKYSDREMALAAIDALNGIYTMRGCDQPLTVRFADPKRPRQGPGDSRGGAAAFGGPGFGPRFQTPRPRPAPNFGDAMGDRVPPTAWHPMSPQKMGPTSNPGIRSMGNQLLPRSADLAIPLNPGAPFGGPSDGSLPGLSVSSSSTSVQGFNQSSSQIPTVGHQISPLEKPLDSPQNLPPSFQLHPQAPMSYSQTQTSHVGQLQVPPASHTPFSQALPSQHLAGLSGQLPASRPLVQPNVSSGAALQNPLNVNLPPNSAASAANQQQLPAPNQQQPLQPLQQSPSQLAQMLFQSSQQAFSQLQQQLQLMQPSNQNMTLQQNSQASKHQWAGMMPQAVGSASAKTPVEWEKPEELTLFEQQQQQQQKPPVQQPQTQLHAAQQASQNAQLQTQLQTQIRHPHQLQQPIYPTAYPASGVRNQQSTQELGYGQLPVAPSPNDPSRFQQGLQMVQELAWKNKP
ncbi:hypothetical protein CXB51_025294 [Gossypium anomalum]|uniref:RRM domain-containing protein n=1 Tax=Gossypium anomalum TaxID=47600 RepID=A0A8J6CUW5_9ROSI|nr:hypothetical protein CXB51_025294 [Gossypium anomalum]